MGQDDRRLWLDTSNMPDDAFETPKSRIHGMLRILIIIDGIFDEEKVKVPQRQDIVRQPKGSRRRAGRGNPRIDLMNFNVLA